MALQNKCYETNNVNRCQYLWRACRPTLFTYPNILAPDSATVRLFDTPWMCCQPTAYPGDIWIWCWRQVQFLPQYSPASRCTTFQAVHNWFPCMLATDRSICDRHHIGVNSRQPTCSHSDIHNWQWNCTKRSCKWPFHFLDFPALGIAHSARLSNGKRKQTEKSQLWVNLTNSQHINLHYDLFLVQWKVWARRFCFVFFFFVNLAAIQWSFSFVTKQKVRCIWMIKMILMKVCNAYYGMLPLLPLCVGVNEKIREKTTKEIEWLDAVWLFYRERESVWMKCDYVVDICR